MLPDRFPDSTFPPMRIGVLGSTGQIGHAICERLHAVRSDIEATAFKRPSRPGRLSAGILLREIGGFDAAGFREALSALDHVIYAIGSPEKWVPDPEYFGRLNFGLLSTFLEALSTHP